ncbi:MAG: sulfurtransferase complex subunit TusB [Pseudomonadota bacterium]|jgi:tRNA 2-thiouridine synthesizing protein B
MSVLHLVNASPFESAALSRCLARAGEGDAVLLLENGVYGALAGCRFSDEVAEAAARLDIRVLAPDLDARGLCASSLLPSLGRVGYDGFVALAARHELILTWT